jgi:hypothetical protein
MSTETISLTRPEGISDGRWAHMQEMAHLVVTGHYPWCTDHEGEPGDRDGWCRRVIKSRVSVITLSNGTLNGAPMITIEEADGVDLLELSVDHAACLAQEIDTAARWGAGFNVDGAPENTMPPSLKAL